MDRGNQVKANIFGLLFISFVFGIIYIVGHISTIIDIISSYVQLKEKSYINISNIVYCLMGVATVLFPVFIIFPYKSENSRPLALKALCYAMGIMFFIGDLWIFNWLLNLVASRSISFDVAEFQKTHNYMYNHLQWASRNFETFFYNYLMGVIWCAIGYNFNRDRRKTYRYFFLQIVVAYFVPMLYFYLYRGKTIPDWWLKKTIPMMISNGLTMFALFYAAGDRKTWSKHICKLKSSHHHHHHHHHQNETGVQDNMEKAQ